MRNFLKHGKVKGKRQGKATTKHGGKEGNIEEFEVKLCSPESMHFTRLITKACEQRKSYSFLNEFSGKGRVNSLACDIFCRSFVMRDERITHSQRGQYG